MLDLPYWFTSHSEWVAASAVLSLVLLVGSAASMPWLLGRLPEDYFLRTRRERLAGSYGKTALWLARNALGALLILVGVAMLVLPGQGLVTILAGIVVADVPGKRRLALWVLRRRGVSTAVDWLRARNGKPPLLLPAPGAPPPSAPQ